MSIRYFNGGICYPSTPTFYCGNGVFRVQSPTFKCHGVVQVDMHANVELRMYPDSALDVGGRNLGMNTGKLGMYAAKFVVHGGVFLM